MRRRIGVAIAAGMLMALVVAVPATADTQTGVAFVGTAQTVAFGDDWLLEVQVAPVDGSRVDDGSGTVEVLVEGVPGTFSTVPLLPGGVAFVAQPSEQAVLGAGEHRFTAIYHPDAGSGLLSSQTSTPYVLTVDPRTLDATARVVDDPSDPDAPFLELALGGTYVDEVGVPGGDWTVTGTSNGGTVLDTTVGGTEDGTVRIPLAGVVRPGGTLALEVAFAPAAAVAPGVTLTQPAPVTYTEDALTPGEVLTAAVVLPWWLGILLALALIGIVAVAVVLLVRRRTPDGGADEPGPRDTDTDTDTDEPIA